MNILLWILQITLALFCFAGGSYKLFQYRELAKTPAAAALSRAGWGGIGAFEITCAALLVVPAAATWMPVLTPLAAAAIILESLALGALFARYSRKLTAANPLVWVIGMGLVAAVVAYGRFAIRPFA
jgi:hypothetical protein